MEDLDEGASPRMDYAEFAKLWNEFAEGRTVLDPAPGPPRKGSRTDQEYSEAFAAYADPELWWQALETAYSDDWVMATREGMTRRRPLLSPLWLVRNIDQLLHQRRARRVKTVWDVKIAQGVREPEGDRGLISLSDFLGTGGSVG